jgi:hypothetical protein
MASTSTSTLTVKKVAKLLRQGKKGRHLDGGPGRCARPLPGDREQDQRALLAALPA